MPKLFLFLNLLSGAVAACMAASPFETADRAVTGDVTVVSVPWAFKDGKINWTFNPTALKGRGPVNHEWVWQLNRMFFWVEMGKAYRATTVFVTAPKCRDTTFVTTLKPVRRF